LLTFGCEFRRGVINNLLSKNEIVAGYVFFDGQNETFFVFLRILEYEKWKLITFFGRKWQLLEK